MGQQKRNFIDGIALIPNPTSTNTTKGDMNYAEDEDKIYVFFDVDDALVSENGEATLTEKTINGPDNLITNLKNSNLDGAAAITNANLAQMANNRVKGNVSGVPATPSDLTKAQIVTFVGATPLNTPNEIVSRDGSGNFAASTITSNLTGDVTGNVTGNLTGNVTGNVSGTSANVTGVVTETHGGTNQSSYTTGDVLYASASNTLSKLPAGSPGQVLTQGGTVPAWVTAAGANAPYLLQNIGIVSSVSSNALTIALTQSNGSTTPGAVPNNVVIAFRDSNSLTGGFNLRSITSSLSITVPNGATLGHTANMNQYVWVYAIDNAGTVELAVSGVEVFEDNSIQNTFVLNTTSDVGASLFSTVARSGVPIRLIGRLLINEASAGVWATNATAITVGPTVKKTTVPASSYAMTIGATTTPPIPDGGVSVIATIERDGKNAIINIKYAQSVAGSGTNGGNGQYLFPSPSGLQYDTNLLRSVATTGFTNGAGADIVGSGFLTIATSSPANYAGFNGQVNVYNSTNLWFHYQIGANTQIWGTGTSAPINDAATIYVTFTAIVPIVGWSTYGP